MSQYLFSLGILLAFARFVHHIWWHRIGPVGQSVFAAVIVVLAISSYLELHQPYQSITNEHRIIWAVSGLVGWFLPEVVRAIAGFVRRLSISQQLIGVVCILLAISVFQDANSAKLIMTIIIMIGALWLIIKKGFKL